MYCSSKTLKQCNPYARWTDNIIFVMFLVQDQSFYELSFRDSMFCYQKCQDSTFWGLNILGFYIRDSALRDWKFWYFTFRNSTFQNSIFSDLYFEIQFNIQGFVISGFDVLGCFRIVYMFWVTAFWDLMIQYSTFQDLTFFLLDSIVDFWTRLSASGIFFFLD